MDVTDVSRDFIGWSHMLLKFNLNVRTDCSVSTRLLHLHDYIVHVCARALEYETMTTLRSARRAVLCVSTEKTLRSLFHTSKRTRSMCLGRSMDIEIIGIKHLLWIAKPSRTSFFPSGIVLLWPTLWASLTSTWGYMNPSFDRSLHCLHECLHTCARIRATTWSWKQICETPSPKPVLLCPR